jgi:hypothetical protein
VKSEFHRKLVDLYAGRELPAELEQHLEVAAGSDADLAQDMFSLRATVESLEAMEPVEYTEESYQRILMRIYARGVDLQKSEVPSHLQYRLPIVG